MNSVQTLAVLSTVQLSTHIITSINYLMYRSPVLCVLCPYPCYAQPKIQSNLFRS